jgi:hypothetical protein
MQKEEGRMKKRKMVPAGGFGFRFPPSAFRLS